MLRRDRDFTSGVDDLVRAGINAVEPKVTNFTARRESLAL